MAFSSCAARGDESACDVKSKFTAFGLNGGGIVQCHIADSSKIFGCIAAKDSRTGFSSCCLRPGCLPNRPCRQRERSYAYSSIRPVEPIAQIHEQTLLESIAPILNPG